MIDIVLLRDKVLTISCLYAFIKKRDTVIFCEVCIKKQVNLCRDELHCRISLHFHLMR